MNALTNDLTGPSPFHAGEQAVQNRLGFHDVEAWGRKIIRDHMPDQHREFFAEQPFLVMAARDDSGHPWVTLMEEPDGSVTSSDPFHLELDSSLNPGDPLYGALAQGIRIGILGIELATRRRNRVNGTIEDVRRNRLTFKVAQSFGNCPQYIRERNWHRVDDNTPAKAQRSPTLTPDQQKRLRSADTFFIASGYEGDPDDPTTGPDASHRGGEPGFVEIMNEVTLRFADYAGNKHFNTIGNLLLDPRVSLLFVDFATGDLLHIGGRATIAFDSPDMSHFPGAQRLVTIHVDTVIDRPSATALRWDEDADSVRTLVVRDKIKESETVTSFVLGARDGGELPIHHAGQHLPIEIDMRELGTRVGRSYSISSAPSANQYRISVKREENGLASRFLHDHVEVGTFLQARKPAGDFAVAVDDRPVVLIGAGVGVTPMISMLMETAKTQPDRRVVFVQIARDGSQHPFKDEVSEIAAAASNVETLTVFTRPRDIDEAGRDYDMAGRMKLEDIVKIKDLPKSEIYMCGPQGFLSDMQSILHEVGASDDHIHWETF